MSRSTFPIRIVVDEITPQPQVTSSSETLTIGIETDPYSWRGSGGVLHDIAQSYGKDDFIFVVSGVQVLLTPLWDLVEELARANADVSLLANTDGTSVGMMLIRCGCLRDLSPIGFVDFKEQALPQLATRHVVRVIRAESPTTMPVRSRETYIAALRQWHRIQSSFKRSNTVGLEDCWPTFSVVESQASLGANVELLDSVVLSGASVGAGSRSCKAWFVQVNESNLAMW